jgi:predicted HicB family RNase H-like nuclease
MSEAIHQPVESQQSEEIAVLPMNMRCQRVYHQAEVIYQQRPDWVAYFREVLGVDGIVRQMFSSQQELEAFEQTEEFSQIQQQVAKLREQSKHQGESNEPTRVITVRLPKSLHESLRAEAHDKHTSMNQLCISKLLQIIEKGLVPKD